MKVIRLWFCRLFKRHLKPRYKPYRKLKASRKEREYVLDILATKILDVNIANGSIERMVDSLGGIDTILNGYSVDEITFHFETKVVVGDFQQILQEYRRLKKGGQCKSKHLLS